MYQGSCIFVTHDRDMVDEGIREVRPSAFHDGQFLVEHGTYQQREAS